MRFSAPIFALLALLSAPAMARANSASLAATTSAAAPPVQRPRMMAPPTLPAASTYGPMPQASPEPAPTAAEPMPGAVESAPIVPPSSPAEAAPPLEVTSSKAPASRPLPPLLPRIDPVGPLGDPSTDHGTKEVAALTRSADKKKKKIPHRGFTVDFRVGMMGCMKSICADRHRAETPGVRLDGFIGGNVKGFVDIGIAGGWGRLKPNVEPGTNVLALYGVDPAALVAQLPPQMAAMIPLAAFGAQDAKLQAAQGGPALRVHFVPRGRMLAYVGSGAQYNLFRADYHTGMGPVRVDLHGLAVPVEVGLGVHVQKNVAVVAQFDWRWTWYAVAVMDNPIQKLVVPMSYLADTARESGTDIRKELPQFWTLGLALRARV